jgi:NitT/TauT family transport system substrate-binding protein
VRLGVPEDDISTILMADHGVDLYGNAIIVNTDFAAENPELVSASWRAVAMGWKDAIADPGGRDRSLIERNPAADAALEQRACNWPSTPTWSPTTPWPTAWAGSTPTAWPTPSNRSALTYEFQNEPDAALYFTDAYLPEGGFALK